MFARTGTYKIPSDKVDTFLRQLESTRSRLEQLPGYVDGYFLVDRSTGNVLSVTLYDSEQSLRSSLQGANQIRADVLSAVGVTNLPPFIEYEVGAQIPGRMRKAA